MSKKDDILFQAIHLRVKDPDTGKEESRYFVGKSIFSKEDAQKHGDLPYEDVILDMEIDQPYNPYEDETNDKAARKALQALRTALKELDND